MKNCIGIRKENIDQTERRAPLIPQQVKTLVDVHDVHVIVEPSGNRVFKEEEYVHTGAKISTDLSDCNIIFGVKEIPPKDLLPDQAYCFFSHTMKAQPYNMPMLKRIIELSDTLLDYELVKDENGKRLVLFGDFAGYAGMFDSLWVLGQRLFWEGIDSPFSRIQQVYKYHSAEEAKKAIRNVGRCIQKEGLPEQIVPFVCGFTGYGHVSKGAQYIFDLLPVVEISSDELPSFFETRKFSSQVVYKVEFKKPDMFELKTSEAEFNLQEFNEHPETYCSRFERFVPYLTMIVNGIYWEPRYPRLLSKSFLKIFYQSNSNPRLRVIGDISCDVEGSIEVTVKATDSRNPAYVYEPLTGRVIDGWRGDGPVVLAVDKLPTEIPRGSSENFGKSLLPFIPDLAKAIYQVSYEKLEIPPEFKKAVIAHRSTLTPNFRYLDAHLA